MLDLERIALALPGVTTVDDAEGRPSYVVGSKMFCCHRSRRRDAVDLTTGEQLDDVLMFRVGDLETKDALLKERGSAFFTTPHFDGYPAVLMRIRNLRQITRAELSEIVADAWLTRAPKRVAKEWLAERGL